jgi:hypothetical protein
VELRGKFGDLNRLLRRLRDRGWYVTVPNPAFAAYVAPAQGPAQPPAETLREFHNMTDDEYDHHKFKVAQICAPLSEVCSR